MSKDYSNKAELCYNGICAKFYDEKANILLAVVIAAVIVVAASVTVKALR